MPEDKTHDLYDFMQQLSDEMAAEYNRIRKRTTEDPGTAGDQGEENWAELLRGWLPSTYKVVTKGRIISQDGRTSPQVDVLVLKSVYPEKLLNKKLYLAAGVAAAFECKTTLKAEHIEKSMKTCVEIKNLYPTRVGTSYRELHAPIVYGLLAHSHSWNRPKSKPEDNITGSLFKSDRLHVPHPRLGLDLLCVADLTTWTLFKAAPIRIPGFKWLQPSVIQNKLVLTSYFKHVPFPNESVEHFTPIGAFISHLLQLLAWEDPTLRDLADYYWRTKIRGTGDGFIHMWDSSVYSVDVRQRVETSDQHNEAWDEWNWMFPYYEEKHYKRKYAQNEESS